MCRGSQGSFFFLSMSSHNVIFYFHNFFSRLFGVFFLFFAASISEYVPRIDDMNIVSKFQLLTRETQQGKSVQPPVGIPGCSSSNSPQACSGLQSTYFSVFPFVCSRNLGGQTLRYTLLYECAYQTWTMGRNRVPNRSTTC